MGAGSLLISAGFSICYGEVLSIEVQGYKVFIMPIIALITTVGILSICKKIEEWKVGGIFDFIGSNTLTILTFHFLCFKLVSLYIIKRDGLPIEQLSDFPAIAGVRSYDWIIYTIVGVALPLIVKQLLKTIKSYLCSLPRLTFLTRRS